MTWHSYRVATDIGVLLIALAVLAYCRSTPKRRPYTLGFALIAAAAVGELVRETTWPARGNIIDLSFTLVDVLLLAAGFIIIIHRWRREQAV